MPGNACTCICKCNASVIDLPADSDEEPIESSRNNSGYNLRKRNQQSRQARKSSDIEVTKATLQTTCTVCLQKFEKIKTEGGRLAATIPCGHIFCSACIKMTCRTRLKRDTNGKAFVHCPNCRTKTYRFCYLHL